MSDAILIAILGSSSVAAIVTAVINAILSRSKMYQLLITADKIILKDRIKHLSKNYINRGFVMSDELEDLHEMYNCYHELDGNGFLKALMDKVNHLEVRTTIID